MAKPILPTLHQDMYGWNSAEDIAQDCEQEAKFHRMIRNIAGVVTIIALAILIVVGLTFNAITLGWGSLLMISAFTAGGFGLSTTISSIKAANSWAVHAEKCRQQMMPNKPAGLAKPLS